MNIFATFCQVKKNIYNNLHEVANRFILTVRYDLRYKLVTGTFTIDKEHFRDAQFIFVVLMQTKPIKYYK